MRLHKNLKALSHSKKTSERTVKRSRQRKAFVEYLAQLTGVTPRQVYYYIEKYHALEYPKSYIATLVAIETSKIYFYSYPPVTSTWSYLLLNVHNYKDINRFIDKDLKIAAVILDAAVDYYWRKPCSNIAADYDNEYWNDFWNAIDYLKSIAKEMWITLEVTVPDYPDDYSKEWKKEHCLWIDSHTNVDRTLENVFFITEQDKNIKWLLPAQGYENTPESILLSLEVYVNHRLHKRHRIALANLCTSKNVATIVKTIRVAREFCGECRFHIFGPSVKAVEDAAKLGILKQGDSFDSTAWTYPRISGLWSARNEHERKVHFELYLKRVAEALIGKTIDLHSY
jgi:hypothetical protein